MMAQTVASTNVASLHLSAGQVICRSCDSTVKPVLMARTSMSHRSNIPGVFGMTKQVLCCPECGERNP